MKKKKNNRKKQVPLCKCNAHNMPHPEWVHQLRSVKSEWDADAGDYVEIRQESELWGKLKAAAPKRAARAARTAFELGAFTTCKGVFERYGAWPSARKQKSRRKRA